MSKAKGKISYYFGLVLGGLAMAWAIAMHFIDPTEGFDFGAFGLFWLGGMVMFLTWFFRDWN